jgi:hypothetical protein
MAKLLRRLMAVSAPVALLLLETAGYRIRNSICSPAAAGALSRPITQAR